MTRASPYSTHDRVPAHREDYMKSAVYAAVLSTAFPFAALAQTADEIKNAERTPQNVLTYGMSYNHQRYSTLTQINRDTVKRLVPAWAYSMNNNTGEESQPLIYNGVMYITSHDKTVAIDALTGKEIWKAMVEYPPDTTRVVCCGIVNRGTAIFEGKIFRTTLDARVIALDKDNQKSLVTDRGDPDVAAYHGRHKLVPVLVQSADRACLRKHR